MAIAAEAGGLALAGPAKENLLVGRLLGVDQPGDERFDQANIVAQHRLTCAIDCLQVIGAAE